MELLTSPASGLGIATFAGSASDAPILDVWYPRPGLFAEPTAVPHLEDACSQDPIRGVVTRVVSTTIADLSEPPADVADAYLRLHLLSHRLVAPRTINMDGIFGVLPNVAWTSLGPVAIESLTEVRMRARVASEPLTVLSVDKFPRMVDYVVPSGVRIADADRVRLGAHLAEGTTVMHEGFCNFNAGTLGPSMVEGRISAGVVVGAGSDIGGGASIMGTLSGGGKEQVTIGEGALIGANGGIGISLGRPLGRGGGLLRDGRVEGPAARRRGREGPRPVRRRRPAVPAQLDDRRPGGHPPHRSLGRAG